MEVIKVENLSKIYDLGLVGTGTLSKDLNRAWAKIIGKPDPYSTIAELNDRTQKSDSGIVYALKDINFSVKQGEVLGIIGKNGAGKSTLLKILSQITSPSSGNIKIKGRVASLLEVGTGMHPEMTARQNIYLNGSIMGMRRSEITSKLEEIIDFAGIAKYVDTPIKRFSSGMQVRLGFAVAAFLEPEILIVDEVLAVGDAEFQKKAVGKMKDVSNSQGRTVLFVSHNMAAVKSLCSKSMLLQNSQIHSIGETQSIVSEYISNVRSSSYEWNQAIQIENCMLKKVEIYNGGNDSKKLQENDEIIIRTSITIDDPTLMNYYHITFHIFDENSVGICSVSNFVFDKLNLKHGANEVLCTFHEKFFRPGIYFLHIYFDINHRAVFSKKEIIVFKIENGIKEIGEFLGINAATIQPKIKWEIE